MSITKYSVSSSEKWGQIEPDQKGLKQNPKPTGT